jgi:hypothetical protein
MHKDSIIDGLKRENAGLQDALAAAQTKIQELEDTLNAKSD